MKSRFDETLSDSIDSCGGIPMSMAEQLFRFFQESPVFRWRDCNNDCEDRANALCILLEQWHIPSCKAWVFGGSFLRKGNGCLHMNWTYHVAAAVPVQVENQILYHVIDPATFPALTPVATWADAATDQADSYYLLKHGWYYIFPPGIITRDNWFVRDKQNFKWTMQGLSGINGVSKTGKAQLVFNKRRIQNAERNFRQLMGSRPSF